MVGREVLTAMPVRGERIRVETTANYAHLAENSVAESAVQVFDSIAADLEV